MIETFKDMKHGRSGSYENLALERTASQILHRMEDQSNGDSLESARARVLGSLQSLLSLHTTPIIHRKDLPTPKLGFG